MSFALISHRISVSRTRFAGRWHGQGTGRHVSRGAGNLRRSRRRARLQALATLLRRSGRPAQADGDHAAGHPDGFGRGVARAAVEGNHAVLRCGTQPGRVLGARRRGNAVVCRCGPHGAQSRQVHAGSGAGRRGRDGCHSCACQREGASRSAQRPRRAKSARRRTSTRPTRP